MRVAVIIPNFNGAMLLGECLDSLAAQTQKPGRIIVVDNGSTDGSNKVVMDHRAAARLVAMPKNMGFAAAVNRGIAEADAEMIALLNNDAVADPGWLEAGTRAAEQYPGVSIFGSLMLRAGRPDLIDSAGDFLPRDGRPRSRGRDEPAERFREPARIMSACAGAAFYRREVFTRVGMFEDSFFAYLEDIDFGLRALAAGLSTMLAPEAVVHHRGASTDLGDEPGGAAMDSSLRVYLIARNRLRLLWRHLPARELALTAPWLKLGLMKSAGHHLFRSRQAAAFARGMRGGLSHFKQDREFHRATWGRDGRRFYEAHDLIRTGAAPWPK